MPAEPELIEQIGWRKASNRDDVPTFSHSGLVCTAETEGDRFVTGAKGVSLTYPSSVFNAG